MSARASRRQALAFIALTDAPTPKTVRFRDDTDDIMIIAPRAEDVQAWATALGGQIDSDHNTTDPVDRETPIRRCMSYLTWRGHQVVIMGIAQLSPSAVDGQLDDATREQLAAVAVGETGGVR